MLSDYLNICLTEYSYLKNKHLIIIDIVIVQSNLRGYKNSLNKKEQFSFNKRSIYCSYGSADVTGRQLFWIVIFIGQNMPFYFNLKSIWIIGMNKSRTQWKQQYNNISHAFTWFSPVQLPLMQPRSTMTKRLLTNYILLSESAVSSGGRLCLRHMQINTLHL